MPSFILIRPTVWPQCTNVTDRQTGQTRQTDRQTDRQRSDSLGRTVLQTVAQKTTGRHFAHALKIIIFRLPLSYRPTSQEKNILRLYLQLDIRPKFLPINMLLNIAISDDLERPSRSSFVYYKPFQIRFLVQCAAVNKLSTDTQRRAVPLRYLSLLSEERVQMAMCVSLITSAYPSRIYNASDMLLYSPY